MNHPKRGMVLVAVLLLTLATWALLAALLTTAYLHYRLALGADRGAVAGAAANEAVDALATQATAHRQTTGAWPASATVDDRGTCTLELIEVVDEGPRWRIAVRGGFEGSIALKEATVHAP
ncbi:MAG: hypothetical protein ABR510_02890 [Trueperaceae bacterium]